jgi:uncharacterized protein YcfL
MKTFIALFSAAVLAAIASGCATSETGAYSPQNTDKYTYEATAPFVLMSPGAQNSVTVADIRSETLADGRLQVAANVRNRENRRIQVQANCEFKDTNGIVVDPSPWQTLILTENSMETIQFASMNKDAKRYTIRVREAR